MFYQIKKIRKILFLLILLLFADLLVLFQIESSKQFNYFLVDCDIYSKSGELIFNNIYKYCDYAKNGASLSMAPPMEILEMRNSKNELLWSSKELVHHDLKFTHDQKSFIIINSEIISFNNENVRSDCISRRNLNNQIEAQWCLGDNLDEFKKFNQSFNTLTIERWGFSKGLTGITKEISHFNTLTEIGENALSDKHPAFKAGNYIVHTFAENNFTFIVDHEMKKILWYFKLEDIPYGVNFLNLITHDQQITPEGKILFFTNQSAERYYNFLEPIYISNRIYKLKLNIYSQIITLDPITYKLEVLYEGRPRKSFYSNIGGSTNELKNKNYLFSDKTIPFRSKVIEANRNGNIVWQFEVPNFETNRTAGIRKTRPIYDLSFLKNRGLIE